MLSDTALALALERVGLTAPVRFDEVTRSTQETALAMASEGAPEWTLVAAAHQTAGRGRLGRVWVDEPGSALMFSLILRPDLDPALGGLLTLLAGSAVALACREAGGSAAACKWPNDVMVDARKVGGILAESVVREGRFEHVAVGVGINLGEPPRIPGAGAVVVGDAELLQAFLAAFVTRYHPAEPAFAREVVSDYRARCATLGTRVRATVEDGSVVEGVADDVDPAGGLVVRTDSGGRVVRFGEVQHLE